MTQPDWGFEPTQSALEIEAETIQDVESEVLCITELETKYLHRLELCDVLIKQLRTRLTEYSPEAAPHRKKRTRKQKVDLP